MRAIAALGLMLGACRPHNAKMTPILDLPPPHADVRIPYGATPEQFGDLRVPPGPGPHPVVIFIHGGYWRAAYGLEHAGHLCAALKQAGVATWSLEYRRIGNPGGGWPGTGEDILSGAEFLEKLAALYALDLKRVVAVGHSAGGQLALWLAAQHKIALRGVVSLAGVSDLRRAYELHLSHDAVVELLGGTPEQVPRRYAEASPMDLLPISVPVRLIHGTRDDTVPLEFSRRYLAAAEAKGDDVRLIELEGAGHFQLIDPRTQDGRTVEKTILDLMRAAAE
jgi:acetyl esterase/lipase